MIGIGYREDGHGKGIFYDHYTIQHATQRSTCALKVSSFDSKSIYQELRKSCSDPLLYESQFPKMINYSEGIRKLLMEYLKKNEKLSLKFQLENKRRNNGLPMVRDFSLMKEIDDEIGLLIIVGHLKIMENDPSVRFRFEFERSIIRKALLIGQPLLCICSGCWRLWEVLGGTVFHINSNVQHASGMINLDSNDGNIRHENHGHEIIVQGNLIPECTLLKCSMFGNSTNPNISIDETHSIYVNSIHWMAPQLIENDFIENNVNISAFSIPDFSIEAFETRFGAPVMGIQWHPEAYILNNEQTHHQNILKYMAKAGDAYVLKRKLLKQLQQTVKQFH